MQKLSKYKLKSTIAFFCSPKLDFFLRTWAIPFGLFVQLTGTLWLGNNSGYMTQTYIWCLLPALISMIISLINSNIILYIKNSCLTSKLLGLMFLWILIHPLTHNSPYTEYNKIITRTLYIITYIYAAAVTVITLKKPERILLICAVIASLFALASIVNQYGFNGYTYTSRTLAIYGNRLYSLGFGDLAAFDNPILAALYYGSLASFIIGWASIKPLNCKTILITFTCIIPLVLFIILSDSRGPIVAVFITMIAAYTLSPYNNFKKAAIIVCLSSLALFAIFFNEFKPAILHTLNNPGSLYIRWDIWEEAVSLIYERPLLGYGVHTPIDLEVTQYTFQHPHNMFLKISLNWGLPAGIIFIALTITGLYQGWKRKHTPITAIAFFLLMFGSLGMLTDTYKFLSRPGLQWHLFFLPLGLIIGSMYRKQPEDSSSLREKE